MGALEDGDADADALDHHGWLDALARARTEAQLAELLLYASGRKDLAATPHGLDLRFFWHHLATARGLPWTDELLAAAINDSPSSPPFSDSWSGLLAHPRCGPVTRKRLTSCAAGVPWSRGELHAHVGHARTALAHGSDLDRALCWYADHHECDPSTRGFEDELDAILGLGPRELETFLTLSSNWSGSPEDLLTVCRELS